MTIIGTAAPATGSSRWTYLYLVQRFAQEVGALTDPFTAIPTLTGVTGEVRRFADWIASAWWDIQGLHPDWQFQRLTTTFATLDGQALYTPEEAGVTPETFGSWDLDSFRSYLTSAGTNGEMIVTKMDYDAWRDCYQLGSQRVAKSQPRVITKAPNGSIGLGPVPLSGYTMLGDYYRAPVELTADNDLTTLPPWHNKMIVVYKAMEDHGFFEAANDVLGRHDRKYPRLLSKLQIDQLKRITGAGALA